MNPKSEWRGLLLRSFIFWIIITLFFSLLRLATAGPMLEFALVFSLYYGLGAGFYMISWSTQDWKQDSAVTIVVIYLVLLICFLGFGRLDLFDNPSNISRAEEFLVVFVGFMVTRIVAHHPLQRPKRRLPGPTILT
ncbi:MAG: hypothetical protein JW816_02325 [Candidatus Buchananbacteria bacterium]|nr:hypothetical protein [Candidatus Buchananbacteria bacterium]